MKLFALLAVTLGALFPSVFGLGALSGQLLHSPGCPGTNGNIAPGGGGVLGVSLVSCLYVILGCCCIVVSPLAQF